MANKKLPDLTKITIAFERAYNAADKASARKAAAQTKFFDAINKTLETQVLKQKLVTLENMREDETPEDFIARQYPGWKLHRINKDDVVIKEDPKFMKYCFLNRENNKVYQRTTAQAGQSIDDERLRQENPKLWEEITEWPEPWYSLIADFALFATREDDSWSENGLKMALNSYLNQSGLQRILKDPSQWTDDQFRAISKYMVPGPVSVRLVKPRDATPEELDNG